MTPSGIDKSVKKQTVTVSEDFQYKEGRKNSLKPGQILPLHASVFHLYRVRNLCDVFREFCVYKLVASHLRKPKKRNMYPKFTQHVTDGPELSQ